jgi:pyruvate/2-oxoglutarate dehydrogenase complex dihydrolipoamide acyltransferase (E2) component
MPHGDLTVTEARVVAWLKREGEQVAQGETVVELETDKGITEVEAPVSGTLTVITAAAETIVAHGERLGIIRPA